MDNPAEDLPTRGGMTKAQELWNAIALDEDMQGMRRAREALRGFSEA